MSNKKYHEYKLKGLCRRCGSDPLPGKTRCEICHNLHLEYTKKARRNAIGAGLCRNCWVKPASSGKSMCDECLAAHKLKEKRRCQDWREQCIMNYGGRCSCCGLSVQKYLQLDHVANDGADHRRELTSAGRGGSLYRWAVANNFPDRLQLLCANCHQAKTYFGGCTEKDHENMRCCNDREISTDV